jgi:hypothetical protein
MARIRTLIAVFTLVVVSALAALLVVVSDAPSAAGRPMHVITTPTGTTVPANIQPLAFRPWPLQSKCPARPGEPLSRSVTKES